MKLRVKDWFSILAFLLLAAHGAYGQGASRTAAINTGTQYNTGGNRVLSNSGEANTFVGVGADQYNTKGFGNVFFGRPASFSNTKGINNAFFGTFAGQSKTTSRGNAFFGRFAGSSNTAQQLGRNSDGRLEETRRLERTLESETKRLLDSNRGGAGADELRQAALRREEAMVALMEAAPKIALASAMSSEERAELPDSVRNHVETKATETGTLEVLGVLREGGGTAVEVYLVDGDRRQRLFAERILDDYMTGTVVTVRGILLQDRLVTDANGLTVHKAVIEPQVQKDEVRSVLVININFSDRQTEPWTIEFANNLFENTIRPWYEESSYGQTSTTAEAIGWFTIPATSQTCASNTFRDQAVAAARAAGYEPNNYNHVVIAFPRVPACSWSGLGQVPGRYTWLNNAMRQSTATHELGHNLGFGHSRSRRCSDGPLDGECTLAEYGDRFDNMGSGGQAQYHASYRAYLGWIPSEDVVTVTPDDGEVVVALRSAASSFGTRVLRVRRGNTNEYLHVETREAVGYDSILNNYPALLNGIAVYLGTNMRSQSIVDFSFTTSTTADAPVQFGEVLEDFAGDVRITPLYNEDGVTYVHVIYGLGKANKPLNGFQQR